MLSSTAVTLGSRRTCDSSSDHRIAQSGRTEMASDIPHDYPQARRLGELPDVATERVSLASVEIGAQVLRGVLIAWNGRDVDESGDEIRESLIEQIRGPLGDEMLKPNKLTEEDQQRRHRCRLGRCGLEVELATVRTTLETNTLAPLHLAQ